MDPFGGGDLACPTCGRGEGFVPEEEEAISWAAAGTKSYGAHRSRRTRGVCEDRGRVTGSGPERPRPNA